MALWSDTNAMWEAQEADKRVREWERGLRRVSWNGMPAPPLMGRVALGELLSLRHSSLIESGDNAFLTGCFQVQREGPLDSEFAELLKNRILSYPHDIYFHTPSSMISQPKEKKVYSF